MISGRANISRGEPNRAVLNSLEAELRPIVGTLKTIAPSEFGSINMDEWDAVTGIGGTPPASARSTTPTIWFECGNIGHFLSSERIVGRAMEEFPADSALADDFGELAQPEILRLSKTSIKTIVHVSMTAFHLDPFLSAAVGPLAGVVRRAGSEDRASAEPEFIVFVEPVEAPGKWVKAALHRWSRESPDLKPIFDWSADPDWMSPEEIQADARLSELRADHAQLVDKFGVEEKQLEVDLAAIRTSTGASWRGLLTTQGDTLVQHVIEALDELGFGVRDMDAERSGSTLLEDLRLDVPSFEAWECIVEVRGYGRGGAKTGDLIRLERMAQLFENETGRPPEARWYIINQNLDKSPVDRPVPFATNREDVDLFAEVNGLVIDTRELLRLRRAVANGNVTKADAVNLLVQTSGIYQFDNDQNPDA